MSEVSQYRVIIKFFTIEKIEYGFYCNNEEQAKEFALARFKDNQSDLDVNPEIIEVRKLNR